MPKRAVYNAAVFTRSRVMDLRPLITSLTDQLLSEASGRGEIDIVGELGYQLTVKVTQDIPGLPGGDDIQVFLDWANAVGPTFEPRVSDEVLRAADDAMDTLNDFLGDLIQQRRRDPGDDLISRSVVAMEAGTLTEDEVLANAGLLFIAGFETTTHFLGNAVYSLLRHRDQWDLFRQTQTVSPTAPSRSSCASNRPCRPSPLTVSPRKTWSSPPRLFPRAMRWSR